MAEQTFAVRLTARVDGYLAAMESAKRATKELGNAGGADLQRLGGSMTKVGKTMTTGLTLPLVAVGGLAIKMSSEFESSFARMEGLAGVTAGEVDGLKASVLDLAGETAQSPQLLADALYEASSAGLSTAEALAAVGVAAKGSAAGMGSAQDIVGLVASAVASYGSASIDAAKATDILTATIRAGRADPAELAGTLGRVLPIASQLGVSFEEVGGATAFLSNVFGDTNRTVTALSGVMLKMVSPTKQGRDALEEMGTSLDELHATIDEDGLMGALALLKEKGFGENATALRSLFDDTEAYQGIVALLADESGNLASTMDATSTSAGALDEAFSVAAETSGFKMKQAWADIQVALIQAGDIIMPIVLGITGAIGELAGMFSGLPKPVQLIVVGLLALVAAAGPVLLIGGKLVTNFNVLKDTMAKMGTGAATAGLAMGAIGLVMIGFTKIMMDNAAKKAELVRVTNEFADALKAEADGQEGAVDAAVAKQVADTDLVAKANALNISQSDLAKIIKGETVPAWDALLDSTNQSTAGLDENGKVTGMTTYARRGEHASIVGVTDALKPNIQAMQDAIAKNKEQADALKAVTGPLQDNDREARRMATANDEASTATGHHVDAAKLLADVLPLTEEQERANTEATKKMSEALDRSTNKFEVAATAAGIFKKALDTVFGAAMSAEDAHQALIEATDALTASVKDNGTSLDINTEKGRNNRDAIGDVAQKARDYAVTQKELGATTQETAAYITAQNDQLYATMLQLGFNEEEAAAYVAQLGLTPESVTTAVKLAKAEELKTELKDIITQLGTVSAGAAAFITAEIERGDLAKAKQDLEHLFDPTFVIKSVLSSNFKRNAGGTRDFEGGPSLVGEEGPEIVYMPRHAIVETNADTRAILSGHSAVSRGMSSGTGSSTSHVDNRSVTFGNINNTTDMNAAWQAANFHLAAA